MGEWLYGGAAPQRFWSSIGAGYADHQGATHGHWKRRRTLHSGSAKRGYADPRVGWGRGRGPGRGH
jgi:hypothetical protein